MIAVTMYCSHAIICASTLNFFLYLLYSHYATTAISVPLHDKCLDVYAVAIALIIDLYVDIAT